MSPAVERIFRGQSDPDWALSSTLDRGRRRDADVVQADAAQVAAEHPTGRDATRLERFKTYAHNFAGVKRIDVQDDLEWWALGRHFGLLSPLLDWSRSPYVAAFFAWADYLIKNNPDFVLGRGGSTMTWGGGPPVVVWELVVADPMRQLPRLIEPGEFEVFSSSAEGAHRQRAQDGVFTMLRHPRFSDIESYLEARQLSSRLTRYEIDGYGLPSALADLSLMNIRYATLFPDLEGAALQANLDEILEIIRWVAGYFTRHPLKSIEQSGSDEGKA